FVGSGCPERFRAVRRRCQTRQGPGALAPDRNRRTDSGFYPGRARAKPGFQETGGTNPRPLRNSLGPLPQSLAAPADLPSRPLCATNTPDESEIPVSRSGGGRAAPGNGADAGARWFLEVLARLDVPRPLRRLQHRIRHLFLPPRSRPGRAPPAKQRTPAGTKEIQTALGAAVAVHPDSARARLSIRLVGLSL